MEICFRQEGVYAIHATEAFDLFLDTAERLGIDVSAYRGREYVWPQMTCMFAVDTRKKILKYIPQPGICAVMASSGVKLWSPKEFREMLDAEKAGNTEDA